MFNENFEYPSSNRSEISLSCIDINENQENNFQSQFEGLTADEMLTIFSKSPRNICYLDSPEEKKVSDVDNLIVKSEESIEKKINIDENREGNKNKIIDLNLNRENEKEKYEVISSTEKTNKSTENTKPIKTTITKIFNVINEDNENKEARNESTQLNKKRGRPVELENSERINQKVHDKFASDNLIRKIQVHFISFIISFFNSILKTLDYEERFLKLNYEFKKNVNRQFFESLKGKKLSDIICNEISNKYKNKDSNENKKIYEKIKDKKVLKNLFDENYLIFFKDVYYKSQKRISLYKYGLQKEIILSEKEKMFKDLINENINNDINNSQYIENMNICVSQNYLPENKFLML